MLLAAALVFIVAACTDKRETARPSPSARKVLRIYGSSTVGASLIPDLAKRYLTHISGSKITENITQNGAERTIAATKGDTLFSILIKTYGSNTGFEALAAQRCDIAMASKELSGQALESLKKSTTFSLSTGEHTLALDALTIIKNPANPVQSLSLRQVKGIFSGSISNWKQVSPHFAGPIHIYSRDKRSGTHDVFEKMVMDAAPILSSCTICSSTEEVRRRVIGDTLGIGYVSFSATEGVTPLALQQTRYASVAPTSFTIQTKEYPLVRGLFLYTLPYQSHSFLDNFITFCTSNRGQKVVEDHGFIAQNIKLITPDIPAHAPTTYREYIKNALRASVSLRFDYGSSRLDNFSKSNLQKLISFVRSEQLQSCTIKLLGFTDNVGTEQENLFLSEQRAQIVAELLHRKLAGFKIDVTGFGEQLPIAPNDTPSGRALNRRVEVWLVCAKNAD